MVKKILIWSIAWIFPVFLALVCLCMRMSIIGLFFNGDSISFVTWFVFCIPSVFLMYFLSNERARTRNVNILLVILLISVPIYMLLFPYLFYFWAVYTSGGYPP